jgi:hypothetical protein
MRQHTDPTLLHMMRRWKNWHFGVTWMEWRLGYRYDCYHGPLWQVRVGPLWIMLH